MRKFLIEASDNRVFRCDVSYADWLKAHYNALYNLPFRNLGDNPTCSD